MATVQQDYSEFLHYLLGWVCSKHVAQTVSRRYSRAAEVIIADKSDVRDPIRLHHELCKELPAPKPFQMILEQWHMANGMIQSLELASHIVCFQVCRFLKPDVVDRSALDLGDLRMRLPCFTDRRLNIAHISYRVVALVHYSGNSNGGHYNCVVSFVTVIW